MKKTYFVILLGIMCFQTACCDRESIGNLNDRISTLENRKISSETATLIAKGAMSDNNFDIKTFDVLSVTEGIDYWEVHFISKCVDCLDNKPLVVINKENGEVVRFYRYGKPSE